MDRYETTFQTWNKVAARYQEKFMDLELYNETYDLFCQLLPKPNSRIFEIGCGPGNITRYLLTRRPDLKIKAIDVAPEMINLARKNVPEAHFEVMDCRKISSLEPGYDGIMAGFCLPYLSGPDVSNLLAACYKNLNSGGILYLSTIETDQERSGFETDSSGVNKMYMYYHTGQFLESQVAKNGFTILHQISIPYLKADGITVKHLVLIARK